jgi:hypothetical protein
LGYFNDLIPGDRKMFFLSDSNLDCGQDHKRLVREGERRDWKRVALAYLGGADPAAYGLDWVPWREGDLERPRPGAVYLINATFFQKAPVFYPETRAIVQSWIAERTPTGKVGDSWYYFEIPGEPMPADPQDPILPSAPFQQYRGYTAFPPTGTKGDAGQN